MMNDVVAQTTRRMAKDRNRVVISMPELIYIRSSLAKRFPIGYCIGKRSNVIAFLVIRVHYGQMFSVAVFPLIDEISST